MIRDLTILLKHFFARLLFSTCLVSGLLAFSMSSYASQQIAVSAAVVNGDSLLIGDHIEFILTAQHDTSVKIFWPIFYDTINKLEIVRIEEPDTFWEGGSVTLSQTYVVTVFDSGIYLIKPISIVYQLKGRDALDTIATRPVLIAVNTLQVDTSQEIAPIKAPIGVPVTLKEFIPAILGGLAVLVLALLMYFVFFRKKKKVESIVRPKPSIPPYVLAKQKLRELEDEKLWQKGAVKLYYIRLSEIVREYIEYRYDTLALESTTEEIIEGLKTRDIQITDVEQLRKLLDLSDMVKFAKYKPLPDQHMYCMSQAVEFVDHTKKLVVESEREETHV